MDEVEAVADRAVLARRVHALQHDQQALRGGRAELAGQHADALGDLGGQRLGGVAVVLPEAVVGPPLAEVRLRARLDAHLVDHVPQAIHAGSCRPVASRQCGA